ncbi:T9SS type A sorting domain-containing protein [Taibaiella koreensis]|uniref:T9SS type A sorting domain-containing protein n=1 Tax=Taibaiella koreensis TaxID=1268548 RepID=UPI000E59A390|nr:peptide-N-glycosidase F-related protein [Taibaiella koreensis]
MKRFYTSLIAFFAVLGVAQANPGDTTWVQANDVRLDYFNNFDTTVTFPDGSLSYRKVLMEFTLGSYACPPGSTYCHQWDYTVLNYVMTPAGDTVEMSRLITPFANTGWSRFPATWKQPYLFDVTDYASLLKNSASIRIHYSGYSGGFTANIRFAFIEGTPDRNVVGYDKLYQGYFDYGNNANPINSHFPVLNKTAPAGTVSAELKFLVTGHGSDTLNQCCEFDTHAYDLYLNNTAIANKVVWRDNCGVNPLYPQGGTWIYDRSNWCPGAQVGPIVHKLPGITAGSSYNINLKFADYTALPSTKGYGGYESHAAVIYYGAINKTRDASLEDIIAPSLYPDHFRENPNSNTPKVRVHNSGSTPITALTFSYCVTDSVQQQYTWNGTLAPLADTEVVFPVLNTLTNLSNSGTSGTFGFRMKIIGVNGSPDEDATNDSLSSTFVAAPKWPGDIVINLRTGDLGSNGNIGQNPWQGTWKITDMAGNTVRQRNDASCNTTYNDTVALPAAGFYKITLSSPFCMGFHWWPYDGTPQNPGPIKPGGLIVKNLGGASLPMKGYVYAGSTLADQGQHDDFGCEYTQYFYVASAGVTSIDELAASYGLSVYPNPASDQIHINVSGTNVKEATVSLVNALGQTVYTRQTRDKAIVIPTGQLPAGLYTLIYNVGDSRKVEKVVIAK